MRDLVNAGAVELVAATVEHGASSERRAPGGETSWCRRPTRQASNWTSCPSRRLRSPRWSRWSTTGKLSNKLARQVVEGVLAGEGEPEQVMTARGLALVRDDSLIQAAVDEALAANPDVAEKIRGGKVRRRARSSVR